MVSSHCGRVLASVLNSIMLMNVMRIEGAQKPELFTNAGIKIKEIIYMYSTVDESWPP